MNKKFYFLLAVLAALALTLAACGGGETPAPAEEPTEEIIEAPEEGEDPEAGEPLEEPVAEESELAGEVVSIFGAFVDTDAERFELSMVPFEERTGIDIQYEGSGDFESLIIVRDEGGNPPDIGSFPQPGLMRDFVQKGSIVPLSEETEALVDQNYAPVWKSLASVEGTPYGLFHRVSVKSLVWYPSPEFDEAGYEIPATWDEMIDLSDQIVADGSTPWCIGMESSGATGWVATDWVEDIMLRLHGGEVYDQWVNHDIPFNDPRVQEAVEYMGDIFLNPDYVLGGTDAILTVSFGDSPNGLFEEPPQCYLHRQASFIPSFFPDDVTAGVDTTIFPLPEINPDYGIPALGAGELYAAFNERPATDAVMQYLATGESGEGWAQAGGALFPHQDFDLDVYPSDLERAQAELILDAQVFRFDASDLMPGSVGAGTFWTGMVDYVAGEDVETVLQSIEDSWPEDSTRVDDVEEAAEEDMDEEDMDEEDMSEEEMEEGSMDEEEDMDEEGSMDDEEAASEFDVNLTVWADETRAPVIEALGADFSDEYGVGIIVQQVGFGDIRENFTVAAPAGEGPDIIIGAHDWLGELAESGLLAEMDLSGVSDNFSTAAVNAFNYDGVQYGLPYAVENVAFVYNQDLIEEAPTTWTEVQEIAAALEEEGAVAYGYVLQPGDAYHFMPIQTAFGGYVFGRTEDGAYNSDDVGIDSEGTIAAAEWLNSMVENEHLSADFDYGIVNELFRTGDAAMIVTGPWELGNLRDSDVNYAITTLPGETQESAPFLGVQGFMVSAFSEDPLLAQAFLTEFVATEEAMQQIYDSGDRPPAHMGVLANLEDEDLLAFGEAGANGQAMPAIPEMGAVWGSWGDAITFVFQQQEAPADAFNNAAEQIRTAIDEAE